MRKKTTGRRKTEKKDAGSLLMRFFGFIIALVFTGMLFHIYLINQVNGTLKEISRLKRIEANLINTNREIGNEIQNLSRADRIQRIASQRLNMVTPEPETLIVRLD